MVTKRKPNPAVKIKQEFIDRVDITKGLAPIFGSTNGKSSEAGNIASTEKNSSSQEFDADAYERSQSLTKRNDRVYGRGNGRGRSRGKHDRQQNRTLIQLRSIGEGENSNNTNTQKNRKQ